MEIPNRSPASRRLISIFFRARRSRERESVFLPPATRGARSSLEFCRSLRSIPTKESKGEEKIARSGKGEEKIGRSRAKPEAAYPTCPSPGSADAWPNIQDGEAGDGPAQQQLDLARNQVPAASRVCALRGESALVPSRSQASPETAWLPWLRINPPRSPILSQPNPETLSQA